MTDPHAAIAAVFRIEFPRLVGALARLTRDVGRTEELAQDALVVALERWPTDGVPDPVLPTEARVALTLRLVSGLASSEIARAFLVPEPTTPVAVTSVLGGLHVDYRRAA